MLVYLLSGTALGRVLHLGGSAWQQSGRPQAMSFRRARTSLPDQQSLFLPTGQCPYLGNASHLADNGFLILGEIPSAVWTSLV